MLKYLQPRSTSASPSEHPHKRQRTAANASAEDARATARSNDVTPATSPLAVDLREQQQAGGGITESVQRKLHSVERHFCSQNLETPQPEGNAPLLSPPDEADEYAFYGTDGEADDDVDDGGFAIRCSQVYVRTQSTQQPGVSSQTDSASAERGAPQPAQARKAPDTTPSGPLRSSDVRGGGNATDTSKAGTTACAGSAPSSAAHTPELSREDEPGCSVLASQSPGRALFPLFRPKSERKVLHLIRHGQSTYNAATASQPSFAEPTIYDARLTPHGQQQSDNLRVQLRKLNLKDALWIVSPLSRALETFQRGCPTADRLAGGAKAAGAPEVIVSSVVTEHCATTGDIGSPASQLRTQFPALVPFMANLPERWWHCPDKNCATKGGMGAWESLGMMKVRVGNFRKLLQDQPHKVIVCVGHSTFFREFISGGRGTRLRNCEVHTQYF